MATDPVLPSIDFTSRDYLALRKDMIDLIRIRLPQWTGDNPNDFGVALVESYAYGLDILHYYLDRVANEAYLDTAVQRESLFSIAKMFNYVPRSATAATVDLEFTNSTDSEVVVPKGTRCQATVVLSSGLVLKNFETTKEISIASSGKVESATGTVQAVEGRTYREETIGVSTGFVSQEFLLPRTSVLDYSVTITTELDSETAEWYEVDDITLSAPEDRVFTTLRQTDGAVRVRFGNSLNGAIPELHSIVRATYRVGGGSAGNVIPNAISTIVAPTIYGVSVTNPSAATGGTNSESLDSIRINAARKYRSRNRAVTLSDYVSVTESMVGVAKAKSVGNNGSSVTVYAVPEDELLDRRPTLSSTQQSEIRRYLEDRAMAGVTISVFGPLWQQLYVSVTAKLFNHTVQADVRTEITNRLLDLFSFQNVGFDQFVSVQDIAVALYNIPGVQYIEVGSITLDPQAGDSVSTIDFGAIAPNALPYFSDGLGEFAASLTLTLDGGV